MHRPNTRQLLAPYLLTCFVACLASFMVDSGASANVYERRTTVAQLPLNLEDKNNDDIPDECERQSPRFAYRSWPLSPKGKPLRRPHVSKSTDHLRVWKPRPESYWVFVVLLQPGSDARLSPSVVAYDVHGNPIDTLGTSILGIGMVQAATHKITTRPPIVFRAIVADDTLYAYTRR